MHRLPDELLLSFASDELSPSEAARVEAHLLSDPRAAATVARFRAARAATRADETIAPSNRVVQKARELYDPAALPRTPSWIDAMVRIVADVVFDSRLQTAAVRSTALDDELQLAWEVDEFEIDLVARRSEPDVPSAATSWRLVGQIASDAELPPLTVAAVSAGGTTPVGQVDGDDRHAFVLELGPGRYDLLVRLPDRVIALENIELE